MSFLSNHVINFIYIAVIILGGVTFTLALILRGKERDRRHDAICFFTGTIFVYMLTDFIVYYCLGERIFDRAMFAMITISDTLFCVLVAAWVRLITVLVGVEETIKSRWIVMVSAGYLIFSQILSVSVGRYDSHMLQIRDGVGKTILQMIDTAYVVLVILIGILCIRSLWKRFPGGRERKVRLILILSLIGYMVWVACWDYTVWYKMEDRLIDVYASDPLILFYALLNLFFIYSFRKKDPLGLWGNQFTPEDAVGIIAERYGLSGRERQVLELLNRGKSNRQIAGELSISENTVKRHINSIFKKTKTQSRYEIVFKISDEISSR